MVLEDFIPYSLAAEMTHDAVIGAEHARVEATAEARH
ncbi:hypothetical protein SEA_TRAAWW1_115 [Mycobacterium phage Traaww1]|nr:hypothetical protein SEA_CZYSZCZON1_118 [Mycobacterium phage Czyszczon1]QGJ91928.1 hypothetical protein SEA_TRAAWW1_115 [Mycobacterium phage Traaww1]